MGIYPRNPPVSRRISLCDPSTLRDDEQVGDREDLVHGQRLVEGLRPCVAGGGPVHGLLTIVGRLYRRNVGLVPIATNVAADGEWSSAN